MLGELIFCALGAHAKCHKPMTIPSGILSRKLRKRENSIEEREEKTSLPEMPKGSKCTSLRPTIFSHKKRNSLIQYLNFNFNMFQNQTKYKDITNIVLTTKTNKLAC